MPPVTADSAATAPAVGKKTVQESTAPLRKPVTAEAGVDGAAAAMAKLTVDDVVAHVKTNGIKALESSGAVDSMIVAMTGTDTGARLRACSAAGSLLSEAGPAAEPFLLQLLPALLERCSDKDAEVRAAAERVAKAFVDGVAVEFCPVVVPALLDSMDQKKNWQTKVLACQLLQSLAPRAALPIGSALPIIVPTVSHTISDAKPQVKAAATECMRVCCTAQNNKDLEHAIPAILTAIGNPAEVANTVHKVGATTFVQQVEAPTLSILVPLLVRGLKERQTAIKRKCCLIIDNMAKLVENPLDAHVFLPRLLPGLEDAKTNVADPECRSVAARAHATLLRIAGDGKGVEEVKAVDAGETAGYLDALLQGKAPVARAAREFVAHAGAALITAKDFNKASWAKATVPYLSAYLAPADAQAVADAFQAQCFKETQARERLEEEEEDEGEDLCNCEFSLAYGAKILLNNTMLNLKRGRRYGLCGGNGTGKSTLMRAIANEQVEGFPPKSELRTVYVEHDIDGVYDETSVVEYVFADPTLQDATHPSHGVVEEVLESVGFDAAKRAQPVASLSGGWKMKLALARAMLMRADILLLDEPTNHLDVTNVAWLEAYLCSLDKVTSIIVSHDSSFLDNVCTDIIHLRDRKLKRYRGNLSEFVKKVPEAKSYYELGACEISFVLPEPGFLEGVKNKDKAIIKLVNMGFRYPGCDKNQLTGVSVQCSLNSRVACIGPNGAGKSTLIKVLTGEMEATEGSVWRHPNLRVAYVAQHAFHHLEKHLDKSPNQYIQWRYAPGEDREAYEKADRQITEEEQAAMAQKFMRDGVKREVEKLVGRRKSKKGYEYEVQWKNSAPGDNEWLPRSELEEMGFSKAIQEIDIAEAARLGNLGRPLTQKEVEKQLMDLGIEPEFGTHSQIRGLSGGQKVKVVIAAAMWLNPHMLILDEPTNYLDRESLGALASAIRNYGGGVVMISHNREFTGALCPEVWEVNNGTLERTGDVPQMRASEKIEWKPQEEVTDALGNTVKVKAQKKNLSNKEKKKYKKMKDARRARGEEVSDSEDE